MKFPSSPVRRCSTTAILLLASIGCGPADDSQPKLESTVSAASDLVERVGARLAVALDEARATAISEGDEFPGAIAAVALPSGDVVTVATGLADVEDEQAMSETMVMPAGSVGKMFAATVVLDLAGGGRLDLDAPISTWLGDRPWFDRLPNGPQITVRILLQHASGLIDHAFDSEAFGRDVQALIAEGDPEALLSPEDLVGYALDREPLFPAGEGFNYTDTGYILLGLVAEAASGELYYDRLRGRVLEPLDLALTSAQDSRNPSNLAQGYAPASAELFGAPRRMVEDGFLQLNPLTEWTGGGVYSNPSDLARFVAALIRGQILSDELLQQMLTPNPASGTNGNGYGLGVRIRRTEAHGTSYGHSGFFPGYNTTVAYFEDFDTALAIQVNCDRANLDRYAPPIIAAVLAEVGR